MASEPITREEMLLSAVATGEAANVKPITREEMFLAKLGGADVNTPTPITRKEQFLQKAIEGGNTGGGGGSSASVPWNDVTFIDYDGTVLHSYSLAEAQALTELPPLPEQKGLICQGWNWSLEDIKAQNGPVIVGAMYITDDGKTRIYITLHEGRTSPMLGVCPNGTVTVDWGDGTDPDVLTGTSTSTVVWTPTHKYASAGDYVISLSVDGEMGFYGNSSSDYGPAILRYNKGSSPINHVYQNAVKKLEIGDRIASICSYAFQYCYSLSHISIPNNVISIGKSAFSGCNSLQSVVIPNGITQIDDGIAKCASLASISIPYGVTSIGGSCFSISGGFIALSKISIPNSVVSIGSYAFSDCRAIESVIIPSGVTVISQEAFSRCLSLVSFKALGNITEINNNAFNGCRAIRYFDFSACTSVPTLASSTTIFGISYDCQILIPAALFDEWSAATNWTALASYMVAV